MSAPMFEPAQFAPALLHYFFIIDRLTSSTTPLRGRRSGDIIRLQTATYPRRGPGYPVLRKRPEVRATRVYFEGERGTNATVGTEDRSINRFESTVCLLHEIYGKYAA